MLGAPGGLMGVWGLWTGLMGFQEPVGVFAVKWVRGTLGTLRENKMVHCWGTKSLASVEKNRYMHVSAL